mgnify:CR=1 FL=1
MLFWLHLEVRKKQTSWSITRVLLGQTKLMRKVQIIYSNSLVERNDMNRNEILNNIKYIINNIKYILNNIWVGIDSTECVCLTISYPRPQQLLCIRNLCMHMYAIRLHSHLTFTLSINRPLTACQCASIYHNAHYQKLVREKHVKNNNGQWSHKIVLGFEQCYPGNAWLPVRNVCTAWAECCNSVCLL